ncbi:hypothetical protein [Chryseobacterium sp. R2ACT005]|uniref:hypothetical protein n=1 Tax=Chryseobacterium sp. R2ACT005 TaxID=3416668 RepID=UPI003CF45563
MDNLTLEFDQFLRSVEISKNDAFTFLLGAGASVTSGIPSAGECIWEWKTNIYETKSNSKLFEIIDRNSAQARIHIQKWLNSESVYPKENSLKEYSFYVKHCYPIEDDRRKYFQKLCEGKQPGLKDMNLIKLGIKFSRIYWKEPNSRICPLQSTILKWLLKFIPTFSMIN